MTASKRSLKIRRDGGKSVGPVSKRAVKKAKSKLTFRKVWYFIWEDDSWASWFVNVILAFVIIKFLIYPGLGWALSTSHPIVAVVSSSMEHDGSFDDWWQSKAMCKNRPCTQATHYYGLGITKDDFLGFPLKDGFNKGDIMVLYGKDADDVKVGDVIVYMADRPDPIIHRVIEKKNIDGQIIFSTKGDHNVGTFYFESYIPEENYIGTAVVRIPVLGHIKIMFVKLLNLIGSVL